MRYKLVLFVVLVLLGVVFGGLFVWKRPYVLQGYVEGDFLIVTVPQSSTLLQLLVAKGDYIKKDARLFIVDMTAVETDLEAAQAALDKAKAELDNLLTGKRKEEISVLEQQVQQAYRQFDYAAAHYARLKQLSAKNFINKDDVDKAYNEYKRMQDRLSELRAAIVVAQLPAREEDIRQAKFEVAKQKALVAKAKWSVEQNKGLAPCDAQVVDTYYVPGERIIANMPIVTLLPKKNKKVRFYLPQKLLAKTQVGQKVQVTCDGCRPTIATIQYIAPQAEYTPPFVYSVDNRERFVFFVECYFANDIDFLHPGQPVDITLME